MKNAVASLSFLLSIVITKLSTDITNVVSFIYFSQWRCRQTSITCSFWSWGSRFTWENGWWYWFRRFQGGLAWCFLIHAYNHIHREQRRREKKGFHLRIPVQGIVWTWKHAVDIHWQYFQGSAKLLSWDEKFWWEKVIIIRSFLS